MKPLAPFLLSIVPILLISSLSAHGRSRLTTHGTDSVSAYPSLNRLGQSCQPKLRFGAGDSIVFEALQVKAENEDFFRGRQLVIVPGFDDFILDRLVLYDHSMIPGFRLTRDFAPGPEGTTYFGDVEKTLRERGVPATLVHMPFLGIAGPRLMGTAVKAALLRTELPTLLVCHSYGFYGCVEALLSMTERQLRDVQVLFYQPTVGGSPISEGAVFGTLPIGWLPIGGIQATRPINAKDFLVPRLKRLCTLAHKIPMSVIVGSAPQNELSREPILKLFQMATGYPQGIKDVDGPNQCPWNDGFVFSDQSAIPCDAISHSYRNGSHVPFFRPGSQELDHLIDEWATVSRAAARSTNRLADRPANRAEVEAPRSAGF